MYDVTPEVRAHWHALLQQAARAAGVEFECIDHPAPAALTDLWSRDDLAAGFMCGFPFATHYPNVRPLAAPVTMIADGRKPTYRSVWLVSADSAFDSLPSTFGHRIGWLAKHSHSGFNAPRHALLAHRSSERPALYHESIGPLEHRGAPCARSPTGGSTSSRSTAGGGGCCSAMTPTRRARSGRSARRPPHPFHPSSAREAFRR